MNVFISAVRNMSTVTEFILIGFTFPSDIIIVFFYVILLSYLITLAGNILIISLVLIYQRLKSPMYFFLCNLAILDMCFTNAIIPNFIRNFYLEGKTISVNGCLAQSYIYFLVGATQFFLLAVMSFDRYVAICNPLSYMVVMDNTRCIQLVAVAWLGSFFCSIFPTIMIMQLSFCFTEINHFFCDVGPLLRNSCTDTTVQEYLVFVSSCITLLSTLLITFISYIKIMQIIFNIQSKIGRQRAFSTCSSHAIVVTLFFGSCIFMYLGPRRNQVLDYNKKVAILNTLVVPLINPYIYTLRNKTVKSILLGKKEF